jgi:O-acetyl-ADP-ribose deacetylase (regulator of RNase III)
MIQHFRGNILSSSCDALVNPINCTPAMGKGLALQFRQNIPGLYEHHQANARAGMIQPGRLTLFYVPARRQTIIGLPTKRDWRDLSRLDDVVAGIAALRTLLEESPTIQSVAIPPLGCGLGGLHWPTVLDHLNKAFEGTRKDVHIYGIAP